jgi:hypothetical protein
MIGKFLHVLVLRRILQFKNDGVKFLAIFFLRVPGIYRPLLEEALLLLEACLYGFC